MNKKMTTYERPTIDVLVVRFEENFLEGSLNYGSAGRNVDYASGDIDDQGDF